MLHIRELQHSVHYLKDQIIGVNYHLIIQVDQEIVKQNNVKMQLDQTILKIVNVQHIKLDVYHMDMDVMHHQLG